MHVSLFDHVRESPGRRFADKFFGELRKPRRNIIDLHGSTMSREVVANSAKLIAKALGEHLLQLIIPAQHTTQGYSLLKARCVV